MEAVDVRTITALKEVPVETIVREANRKEADLVFGPSIDGVVMPQSPENLYQQGKVNFDRIMIGTTTQDDGGSVPLDIRVSWMMLMPEGMCRSLVDYAQGYFPDIPITDLLSLYSEQRFQNATAFALMRPLRDRLFTCPNYKMIDWLRSNKIPVFQYTFGSSWKGGNFQTNVLSKYFFPPGNLDHGFDTPIMLGLS